LVAFADAAKAANAAINPGYEVEILVEALGHGSFKTKVRAVYNSAQNLFDSHTLKNFVIELMAAFIIHQLMSTDPKVEIIIKSDEVVITQGKNKVIVPRQVHESMEQAKRVPEFKNSIGRVFEAVDRDKAVSSLGLAPKFSDAAPAITVPRSRFAELATPIIDDDEQRVVIETTDVQIMRAILERKPRRWEFVWQGIRVAAPVRDVKFHDDFAAHKITIAPGDVLKVKLLIRQRRHASGVYVNDPTGYEVLEVLEHVPQAKQARIS